MSILNECEREDNYGPNSAGVRFTHPSGAYVEILHDEHPHWNPVEDAEGVEISFREGDRYSGTTDDHPSDPEVTCLDCDGSGYGNEWAVFAGPYDHTILARGFETEQEADAWADSLVSDTWVTNQTECPTCEGRGEVECDLLTWFQRTQGAVAIHEFSTGHHNEASAVIIITTNDFTDPQEAAQGYADEYSKWAEGDVWGIAYGGPGTEEESVWGFIGQEYAEEEAADFLGYAIAAVEREQNEARYWAEREVVTV